MRLNEICASRRCPRGRFSCFFVLFLLFPVCFAASVLAQEGKEVATLVSDDWALKSQILSQKLEHGNSEEKRNALFEIRNLRTGRASRLAVPALRDPNEIVRATAAASVVFLPDSEAVASLVPLLSDKAEFVRREAAYALGEVGNSTAAAPLLRLFQSDKILEVRAAAAISLGQIGNPSALPQLASLLKTKPSEDLEFLRRSAARSIGQIAQIVRTGKRTVLTPQNFLPEKYKDIPPSQSPEPTRQYPQFGSAIPVLINVLKNHSESDDTRREAAFALGAIGDPTAITALHAETNSPDPYLAEIAKEAVRKSQDPEQ